MLKAFSCLKDKRKLNRKEEKKKFNRARRAKIVQFCIVDQVCITSVGDVYNFVLADKSCDRNHADLLLLTIQKKQFSIKDSTSNLKVISKKDSIGG